jgi:hypothetical protein
VARRNWAFGGSGGHTLIQTAKHNGTDAPEQCTFPPVQAADVHFFQQVSTGCRKVETANDVETCRP